MKSVWIHNLETRGYEVYIEHERPYDETGVLPGGITVCLIFEVSRKGSDGPVASATARCRPEDKWNRELGAEIAFSRAVGQLAWQQAQHTLYLQGIASNQASLVTWLENEVEHGNAAPRPTQ